MSTPYDTDEELLVENDTSLQIRALNDRFRTEFVSPVSPLRHSGLVCTSGIAAYGDDFIERALRAVREFATLNEDNDPYGAEHDFGTFELDGLNLYWKIEYYDALFDGRSRDPADAAVTRRVLTILLAEEY
jgi:Protein of unknown function (DUF3768)